MSANVIALPSSAPDPSEKPNCTDLGNAQRLVAANGNDFRYCVERKSFYVWNGWRWELDIKKQVERWAKGICKEIIREALADIGRRKELLSWSMISEDAHRLDAMIKLAKSEVGVAITADEFDRNPLLLGVSNGTVDLQSGQLRPAERSDLITKQAGVAFDLSATCPRWDLFITEITNGDTELAKFLQKLVGYTLTGLTREQCLFVMFGSGSNGKGKFLNVLQELLGDYSRTTPPETLMARSNTHGPTPDLARLHGARLVVASEPKDGSVFEESVIKRLTGEDRIACRDVYQSIFEYTPAFKILLATNHKPRINDLGYAIWRRIHLVPFTVTFPKHLLDKVLFDKLKLELSGILNWSLEGLKLYLEEGLDPPECVRNATNAYRHEMDVIGDWIDDQCVKDPQATTPLSTLYTAYRTWCLARGYNPVTDRKFASELEDRGFPRKRTSNARCHTGIKL